MFNEMLQNVLSGAAKVEAPKEKGFFEQMFDEVIVGPFLDKLIEKNPDLAKEYLSVGKDYVTAEGQIDRQTFLRETTLNEKISVLLSIWFADNIGGEALAKIDPKLSDLPVEAFETIQNEFLNKEVKGVKVLGNNIVHSGMSLIFGIAQSVLATATTGEGGTGFFEASEALTNLKVPKGASVVVPKPESAPNLFMMKALYRRKGINLKVFSYDELIPDPSENETQIVLFDESILPNPERPSFDSLALKKCRRLFERGNVIWKNPLLVAGILKLQGKTSEEAIAEAGLPADENLKKILETVGQPQLVPEIQTSVQAAAAEASKVDTVEQIAKAPGGIAVHLKAQLEAGNVDKAVYESALGYGIKNKQIKAQEALYYIIQGVDRGILAPSSPKIFDATLLNIMPSLEIFSMANQGKFDMKALAAFDKDKSTPAEAFAKFYTEQVLTNELVKDRTEKSKTGMAGGPLI